MECDVCDEENHQNAIKMNKNVSSSCCFVDKKEKEIGGFEVKLEGEF